MKTLKQIQLILAAQKAELRKKYKIKEIGIFGSYARGEQKKSSDIDILAKFDRNASLFDLAGAADFLEQKLKTKVDLVSEGGIRAELRSNILREVVMV